MLVMLRLSIRSSDLLNLRYTGKRGPQIPGGSYCSFGKAAHGRVESQPRVVYRSPNDHLHLPIHSSGKRAVLQSGRSLASVPFRSQVLSVPCSKHARCVVYFRGSTRSSVSVKTFGTSHSAAGCLLARSKSAINNRTHLLRSTSVYLSGAIDGSSRAGIRPIGPNPLVRVAPWKTGKSASRTFVAELITFKWLTVHGRWVWTLSRWWMGCIVGGMSVSVHLRLNARQHDKRAAD